MAYTVVNHHDSTTIIGCSGAENLLNDGDALLMVGGSKIIRAHGGFIARGEEAELLSVLKAQPSLPPLINVGGASLDSESEEDSPVFDRGESGDAEFGTQRGDKMKRAAIWLEMMLSENGPTPSTELYEAAAAEEPPISKTSLFEVSKRMKVRKTNPDGGFKAGQSQIWSM